MKVELVVTVMLATAVVVTLVATKWNDDEKKETFEPVIPEFLISYSEDQEFGGDVYLGMSTLETNMRSMWKSSRAKGRVRKSQSRIVDRRARRDLFEPTVRFSRYQPSPEHSFVATLELQRQQTMIRFPVLIDRKTGKAKIFANEKWLDYEDWLKAKKGVHL